MITRELLRQEKGNDGWTPDLKSFDNDNCHPYVQQAKAAIEVEVSLWQVKRATVQLSFTVKEEDLQSLRNWVETNHVPLFIVQIFYDCAYVLPFTTLEDVILLPPSDPRHVAAKVDHITRKATYMIPLNEGSCLGSIAEPHVEGKVFKAPNGKVTVYGRLTGSSLEPTENTILELLAGGTLTTSQLEGNEQVDSETAVAGTEDE